MFICLFPPEILIMGIFRTRENNAGEILGFAMNGTDYWSLYWWMKVESRSTRWREYSCEKWAKPEETLRKKFSKMEVKESLRTMRNRKMQVLTSLLMFILAYYLTLFLSRRGTAPKEGEKFCITWPSLFQMWYRTMRNWKIHIWASYSWLCYDKLLITTIFITKF